MVYGAWCMVQGAWCMVHVAWCKVYGAWCMVYGAWSMVHGAWCMLHGAWCMVHGVWCMVHVSWCGSWWPRVEAKGAGMPRGVSWARPTGHSTLQSSTALDPAPLHGLFCTECIDGRGSRARVARVTGRPLLCLHITGRHPHSASLFTSTPAAGLSLLSYNFNFDS
jgi:hypothetical protein